MILNYYYVSLTPSYKGEIRGDHNLGRDNLQGSPSSRQGENPLDKVIDVLEELDKRLRSDRDKNLRHLLRNADRQGKKSIYLPVFI